MSDDDGLKIIVRGRHASGKTTVANLIRSTLEECGFQKIVLRDLAPLPGCAKGDLAERLARYQESQVSIVVELSE